MVLSKATLPGTPDTPDTSSTLTHTDTAGHTPPQPLCTEDTDDSHIALISKPRVGTTESSGDSGFITGQNSLDAAPALALAPAPALAPVLSNEPSADTNEQRPNKRQWLRLQHGYSYSHLFSFLLASLFTISFFVFINSSQVFILKDVLQVPDSILGDTSGSLVFYDQIVTLLVIALWGGLSDIIGRRWVYVLGYTLIGIAFILYPLAANVYPQLLLLRILFSIGGAAVATMISAVLADLADERDRGKIAGIAGCFTGLGALVGLFGFLRIPVALGKSGIGLKTSYWVVAGISILLAMVLFVTLPSPALVKKNIAEQLKRNAATSSMGQQAVGGNALVPPSSVGTNEAGTLQQPSLAPHHTHSLNTESHRPSTLQESPQAANGNSNDNVFLHRFKTLFSSIQDSLEIVYRNPRIILGFIGSFLARGDTIAVTLFVPLWVYKSYVASGRCPDNATKNIASVCPEAYVASSILTGVIQTFALVGAPIFGYITDRVYHPLLMIISSVVAMAGYFLLFISNSPDAKLNYFVAFLIGMGEIGLIVVSLTLVTSSRHLPVHLRGSVTGLSSFCGALGILVISKAGGIMFDSWTPGSPFLLVSLLHIACIVAALSVVGLERKTLWSAVRSAAPESSA
ncbi:hypothetical protein BASA50_004129 [Batrachochytrium salamandrivorans]|uniref:Major facilitator superfamily (MFS) profile domain-containing protein n=1 Tax=Batrachochytrium salamandrivorans TaxID=1357716 RepID=A0ABQ8FGM0_9FUNG|nr:hypothetical protein BASA50_004129 [Batrachochytrium salamandrivorans]